MLIDFRQHPEAADAPGNICVIGAGAAGVTLARRLMRAGKDVILLESGGTDFEAATQELYRGANLGLPYYPLVEARLRFFGGGRFRSGAGAPRCSTRSTSSGAHGFRTAAGRSRAPSSTRGTARRIATSSWASSTTARPTPGRRSGSRTPGSTLPASSPGCGVSTRRPSGSPRAARRT